MSCTLPAGYVVHLPRQRPVLHGPFSDPVSIPAQETPSGHPQTERTCVNCGAVKITVHGLNGFSWREWRAGEGKEQMGEMVGCTVDKT